MSRPPSRTWCAQLKSALVVVPWACAGASDGARDVVPQSRDVVVDAGSAKGDPQGYEYVAKRPVAVVALAEARAIPAEVAHAAVDRLADALDACVTERGRHAPLVQGAARVVAQVGGNGTVEATKLRIDPGPGIAESALICLVTPIKLLTFPAADGGVRGFAIEALWGRPTEPR
jgi:hypothetical protein